MYLTIYIVLPYFPGNQLCILGSEIKDQYLFTHLFTELNGTIDAKLLLFSG